jgi:hypothetical protein
MTLHKHLKERVRTRMRKTGESYTTARRHILNLKSDGVVRRDPALRWHFPGTVPGTTALRILLAQAGVRNPLTGQPFSEPLLFAMAGGVGIGMCAFYYAKENFASFFLGGRQHWFDDLAYLREALERLGLEPIVRESSGSAGAAKQLSEALTHGPCVAWVDSAMLPHRAMPKQFQGGGYHVVTAYKLDGEQAVIGDLTDEPIEIAVADLAAARARIKKQKNRLLRVEPCAGQIDLPRVLQDGLQACARGLVSAHIGAVKANFRLPILKTWAERLHASKDSQSWERIFAAPANFWRALLGVYECIETHGTGGGLCRTIFAAGLAEAADAVDDARLQALARRYGELGAQWTALAEAALPADVPLFAEARALLMRRAELTHAGGPAEALADVWAQLDALRAQAQEQFPLSKADGVALRASLQKRVLELHEAEVSAQQALRSHPFRVKKAREAHHRP